MALKVKHLRCFLQAKNIANHTCTEKHELVDLIVKNRHAPFTRLQQIRTSPTPQPPPPTTTTNLNQQQFHTTFNQFSTSTSASSSSSSTTTTTTAVPPPPPTPPAPPKQGNFTNFQHTMSSFASQMNHFAANLQDYVTNTVSGVLHHALASDHQQMTTTTTTTTNNGNGTSSTFNFGTTTNGPFTYSFSSPGNFIYTTTTSNSTLANSTPQQQRRTTTTATTTNETSASSNTVNKRKYAIQSATSVVFQQQQSCSTPRIRRKSLSELNNEQNIEDLTVRELKEILVANFVDYKGCVEKTELIEKVRRLYRDRQNEKIKGNLSLLLHSRSSTKLLHLAKELDSATASDSELCKVCMDAIADCVFLDCGHMVC